jgi:hypothetical protein
MYMSSKVRDDFSAGTIRLLAARAGHRCSNPSCRRPTIGPGADPTEVVILGEAAHITGASPGGARYDATLTSDERKHYHNGLWCCPTCATLIDKDEAAYPVETLRQWKKNAEADAKKRLEQAGLPVNLLKGLELLDDYFSIPEAAKKLGVGEEQIYRWAMTRKLLLAVTLRKEPLNYDEVRYEKDEHGNEVKITTEHRTIFAMRSPDMPSLEVLYIHPDDVVGVIQNRNPSRVVKVSKLFYTHELLPKKGIGYMQPKAVEKDDLVLTKDELERFIMRNLGLM